MPLWLYIYIFNLIWKILAQLKASCFPYTGRSEFCTCALQDQKITTLIDVQSKQRAVIEFLSAEVVMTVFWVWSVAYVEFLKHGHTTTRSSIMALWRNCGREWKPGRPQALRFMNVRYDQPYSLDLTPCDVPKLKKHLKGHRFGGNAKVSDSSQIVTSAVKTLIRRRNAETHE